MKYRFGDLTLDLEASRLLGPGGEIRLRPQAFRMLEVLVESAPKILSQEELLDRVWGVEHLSPASVKQAVSEVRQALGDDPARPRIIETVHRRGYRFIAPLERLKPGELATQPMAMEQVLARLAGPSPSPPPPAPSHRRWTAALLVPLLAGIAVAARRYADLWSLFRRMGDRGAAASARAAANLEKKAGRLEEGA